MVIQMVIDSPMTFTIVKHKLFYFNFYKMCKKKNTSINVFLGISTPTAFMLLCFTVPDEPQVNLRYPHMYFICRSNSWLYLYKVKEDWHYLKHECRWGDKGHCSIYQLWVWESSHLFLSQWNSRTFWAQVRCY